MAVAANPYDSWSLTAHGELSEQVKAVPPSQPDLVSGLVRGLSFASQVRTGSLTAAFWDQAQDGLQQSQYLVDFPVPEAAYAIAGKLRAMQMASGFEVRILNDFGSPTYQ